MNKICSRKLAWFQRKHIKLRRKCAQDIYMFNRTSQSLHFSRLHRNPNIYIVAQYNWIETLKYLWIIYIIPQIIEHNNNNVNGSLYQPWVKRFVRLLQGQEKVCSSPFMFYSERASKSLGRRRDFWMDFLFILRTLESYTIQQLMKSLKVNKLFNTTGFLRIF